MNNEKQLWFIDGFGCLIIFGCIWLITAMCFAFHLMLSIPLGIISVLVFFCSSGFFVLQPNESRVVTLFGRYVGTVAQPGFYFTYPFTMKNAVSLRLMNINTTKTKVNDLRGNPIEIAAVIVWKVVSPYNAFFGVQSYKQFVETQCEAAIRSIAAHFPYDAHDDTPSLRGHPEQVSDALEKMLQERLASAGIQVVEARLSDLAYAPEIAQAMLRRQQAEAQIAARKYIVDNAVTMVEEVLGRLEKDSGMPLEGAQKFQLVNNLLIALVSEGDTKPVINIGQS